MSKRRMSMLTLAALGGSVVTVCVLGVRPYRSMRGRFKGEKRQKGLSMAIQKLVKTTEPPQAAFTQLAVKYYSGEVQYHKSARTRAVQLRRSGQVNEASTRRLLEYMHCVRCAELLTRFIGVDGGTGIQWFDDRRIGSWVRARNTKLAVARTGSKSDPTLPLGKAILYKVTRGPRSGACYDLFAYHKTNLQYSRKMLKYARRLQQKRLEDQARELLFNERERSIRNSFLPGESVQRI